MLYAAKISLTKMRNSVLFYGFVAALLYVVFLLTMKTLNLMYITELRLANYLILCLVCMYQIKRWIIKNGAFVPFLQVFTTAFVTGIFSFILFSSFLYVYTMVDAELNELFVVNAKDVFSFFPTLVIFFEGSAVSIIVALINLQYFRRYEEGEKVVS